MQKGNENWKWGVVVLLLTLFLITANQAYQHLASQEDFAPPEEDYRDSWDLEHQSGPGAGQLMQATPANDYQRMPSNDSIENNSTSNGGAIEPIVIEDNVNWNQSNTN